MAMGRPTECADCGKPIEQNAKGLRKRCPPCQQKRVRARVRVYCAKHREKRNVQKRMYNQTPERKAHNKEYKQTLEYKTCNRVYLADLRAEMLALYGNACQRCGESDLSILDTHHSRGGNKDGYPDYSPELRYWGVNLWRAGIQWVADHDGELPPDIEVLCKPCHRKADKELKVRDKMSCGGRR